MPARGIATGRQGRNTGERWAWTLIVVRESYQTMKVELPQEHTRDKVRRRFTLSVTASCDETTGQAALALVMGGEPGYCSLSVELPSQGDEKGHPAI